MKNIDLNNEQVDKVLGAVEEVEELLNDIKERHLYDDGAKLTKLKADFAWMHLKLRQQQKAHQQGIKTTPNEELRAEM